MEKNELVHVAIIMDGNGRWAERHGLPRVEGHKKGAERVIDLVRSLKKTSIKYLTLYAFSTENWSRSEEEVSALMNILCEFLDQYKSELIEKRIRLLISGRRDRMPEECLKRMDDVSEATSKAYDITVIFALNYGGRQEITDAVRKIAENVRTGALNPADVNEELIGRNLYHPEIPDPDLLIRTSGELRISNFLLWELSYSEFYFTNIYWPDFDANELKKACDEFQNRKRRFGGRK